MVGAARVAAPSPMKTRAYERWLRQARIPLALAAAVASALFAAASSPSLSVFAMPIAYATGTIFALAAGGKRICAVLLGTLTVAEAVGFGTLLGALGALCVALSPPVYCIGGPCSGAPHVSLWLLGFAVFLFAPIFETIVIQGWLQTRIADLFGPSTSTILTALVFIVIHARVSVVLVVLAFAFSIVRTKHQSLLAIMIAHTLANISAFLITG